MHNPQKEAKDKRFLQMLLVRTISQELPRIKVISITAGKIEKISQW
jgi:hypothetical protein